MDFFKSTIQSKLIKYLLYNTPLVTCPIIEHNDYMVKGVTYINNNQFLKCTESGIFKETHPSLFPLYVDDDLLVTDDAAAIELLVDIRKNIWKKSPLVVTDNYVRGNTVKVSAEYDVVGTYVFGEFYNGYTNNFISTNSYYDSYTHKCLGDYLRMIQTCYNLNLLPLYNCYCNESISNVYLKNNKVIEGKTLNKVLLVPIKFNKTYTISFNSPYEVKMYPILYNNGLMKTSKGEILSNMLLTSQNIKIFDNMRFENSVNLSINVDSKEYFNYSKYLYLAIEVSNQNTSTLSVIEGQYDTYKGVKVISADVLQFGDPQELDYALTSNLSLLNVNDGEQHPISDKLLSYLLRFTIDTRTDNEYELSELNDKFLNLKSIFWSDDLRFKLFKEYMNIPNKYDLNKDDILGYIDLDVENAIYKRYL